ncbi:GspE/PulE family protein [Burkholderia seminalis]|uniref:GspE/PulE family protein n=1 Tax=Burkholderia seminalis TaxID=488731 RepID=UPI0014538B59|nr:GspE/PulE family protein [Burkholderia seminalis]MCA8306768.1 GspE/PulE family protein [Burkholderia seminalis]MCA8435262.1 GspE/PulE family protein [Burkholderia seminalis]VWC11667.1 general secretory pathway protein E [Burkholderia seminalis]
MNKSDAFSDALLEQRLLDSTQLEYARQRNAVVDEALWRTVVETGLASETRVAQVLADVFGFEFVDIDLMPPSDSNVLKLFRKEQCLSLNFLPLYREEQTLVAVIGDGDPVRIAEAIMQRCSCRCRLLVSEFSAVRRHILHRFYFEQHPPEKLLDAEIKLLSTDSSRSLSPENLLNHLLHFAVRERSTDIHVSPSGVVYHVLFRIDGVLCPVKALPISYDRLISYIKLVAEMDIAEQRRPQDGSFRTVILDDNFTVRVSTIVTEHGERVVMRLLPEAHDLKGLAELGFFADDVAQINACMANPSGLVLITGPTGSGKSSTLHAGLRMQRLIERNVLTVEDPLEYRVPGAAQTEVNRRAGYDFSSALRHFLRHDPDVILVGEMRDAETAQAAFEAATTGHLVLSTLHVTSVFGVLPRLLPFGISPQIIAENLVIVINQRLVRRNCPHCVVRVPWSEQEARLLNPDADSLSARSYGCSNCRQTGYLGRLPVYEILSVGDELANAIAENVPREKLRNVAINRGFLGISEVARRRVLLGQTTFEETVRVLGEGVFH